jgi:hypothetical protein
MRARLRLSQDNCLFFFVTRRLVGFDMFGCSQLESVELEEIEAALAGAIQSSAGGQMTRNAEGFLAGVCAKHLTEQLVLAGFVFMRRTE